MSHKAITEAVSFLLGHQDPDGAWRDFQLAPGRSEAWVTAYVGLRLNQKSDQRIEAALDRAARFILSSRTKAGWGYNSRCPADADTTAHCILFLRARGVGLRPADYAALARFQLSCGGFGTYKERRADGWGLGHPDVTVLALRTLYGMLDSHHTILGRGLSSLRAHLAGPHAAKSYWWTSCTYLPLQAQLLAAIWPEASALDVACSGGASEGGCFEGALALELAVLRGAAPERLMHLRRNLETKQQADGSWPSTPILRITNPRSAHFDDELFARSPVATDDRRLFTTATVLGGLTR